MSRFRDTASLLPMVFGLAAGCALAPHAATVTAPRPTLALVATERPPSDPDRPFAIPTVHERRLGNGVRLLMVERRELPILMLRLIVRRGAADAPPTIASYAATALSSRGVVQGTAASEDALTLSVSAITRFSWSSNLSDQAYLGLATLLREPGLSSAEFEHMRADRRARDGSLGDPWLRLGEAERSTLYPPAHPYSHGVIGDLDASQAARFADLCAFFRDQVRPDQLTIVAVGDLARESLTDSVTQAFGTFGGRATTRSALPEPLGGAPGGVPLTVVDEPDFAQAQVRVAARGLPFGSQDWWALSVLNTVLGDALVGRLDASLREEKSYTYGAHSSFWGGRGTGLFEAWTLVERESVVEALGGLAKQIERLRNEPLPAQELSSVKRALRRRQPLRFSTLAALLDAVSDLAIHDLPADALGRDAPKLAAVTSADVQRVARALLEPDDLRWFVLGDARALVPILQNTPFGPLAVVGVRGPVASE